MSVYSHRNGWQARVTVKGQKLTRNFAAHEKQEAEAWAASLRIQLENTHEPLLGGPSRTTLARALLEYARLHSIHKLGVARELTRINRYLLAAGLPTLSVEETDDDRVNLVETPPPTLPRTFAAHQESRARAPKKTNAMRATLAQCVFRRT
ncbi:MAG: hypothetical protein ACTHNZ_18220 [Trinickia sp.]|uniref:hypothetical protein n=1 Tax=Trinickia sp. TaxID=2571163 RepID=UPI003F821C71